ncbi:MAG: hypothetical protein RhofKO_12700 [Rhodothermales bacterium]
MKTCFSTALTALLFAGIAVHATAQVAPAQGAYNTTEDNVAIEGYDVVSYFTQYEAQQGSSAHAHAHDGVMYHFASAENKALFAASPEQFLPQYGGFCAFGLGKVQKKFPVDPEVFKIVDDELFLFFNGPIRGNVVNSIVPWNADEASLKAAADVAWASQNH